MVVIVTYTEAVDFVRVSEIITEIDEDVRRMVQRRRRSPVQMRKLLTSVQYKIQVWR